VRSASAPRWTPPAPTARRSTDTKIGRLIREPDGRSPCAVGFELPTTTPPAERSIANDYSAAGVTTSLEESLARLGLRSVHTLRIHDPNDNDTGDGSDEIATAAGVRRPGDRSIYNSIYLTTVDPNEWPTCNLGVRCGRCGGAARGHA
jgi:hypothetical protein